MQYTSDNIIHKQAVIRKKVERGIRKKSQPCLQNELQSGPGRDDSALNVSNISEQSELAVVVPLPKDILCGRGKSSFNHEGNKRFRKIVYKYINAYISSPRSKRSDVVKAVLNETLGTGARFLKKSENSLEWHDGGEKVAREKVGHALRDATSDRSQQLSRKMHSLHVQKKHQQTLRDDDENESKCEGTIAETLDLETFSTSSPDSLLLEHEEAREKPMRARSRSSPCFENAPTSTKYDEQISVEVENRIFSEEAFHNDVFIIFSGKHKYGSGECKGATDAGSLDMHEKMATRVPSLDSLLSCEEPIEPLVKVSTIPSSIHLNSLDGVQKPNLKYDDPDLTGAATSIFSHQYDDTKLVCNRCCHEEMKKFSAFTSKTSEKQENTITRFRPQIPFLPPGRERTRNLVESYSSSSVCIQEPRLVNFKYNESNPNIRAATSKSCESCAHSNFNNVLSKNQQNGTMEYLKKSSFTKAQFFQQERDIPPIQSLDAIIDCHGPIAIPSDSIKFVPNHLGEFQKSKSNFRYAKSRNKMGSVVPPITSEPCPSAILIEFGSKNHKRTQSGGSCDSSHIDIFNNIHLEELDSCLRIASLIGCQDDSDS